MAKKNGSTIAPPEVTTSMVSIGNSEFHINTGTTNIKSTALKREYALSCKALVKASVAVQGAYYDIAKSFARVQDSELYKDDFASMTEYVTHCFGIEESKAASTISIFVKAGREYLLADETVTRATEVVQTVLADPNKTEEEREAAQKALDHAQNVRNIHASMTPARIAEMRNTTALAALESGTINGTETLRKLREVNKSLAPVKAKARAEKRIHYVVYDSSMRTYGNPRIMSDKSQETAWNILTTAIEKVSERKNGDDYDFICSTAIDLTYENHEGKKAALPVNVVVADTDGKVKQQTISTPNHTWTAIIIRDKKALALETYYVCATALRGQQKSPKK